MGVITTMPNAKITPTDQPYELTREMIEQAQSFPPLVHGVKLLDVAHALQSDLHPNLRIAIERHAAFMAAEYDGQPSNKLIEAMSEMAHYAIMKYREIEK